MQNPKASEYPVSILKALAQVRTAVPSVPKSGHNAFHHYDYASESDVLSAYNPAMNAAGLIVLPAVLESHDRTITTKNGGETTITRVVMEFTLAHKDGDVWPVPLRWEAQGEDSQDKGIAKAITSATKYFLTSLFQAEKGTDPDADGGAQGTRKAPKPASTPRSAPDVTSATRVCPNCGKDAIRKGAEQYGGGWFCSKTRGGCGAKFPVWPSSVPESPAPPAPAVPEKANAAGAVAQGTPSQPSAQYVKLLWEIDAAGKIGLIELARVWGEARPRIKKLAEDEQNMLTERKDQLKITLEAGGE